MYLSSRAIGQIKSTRELLASVSQNELGLPEGPIIVSPDTFFTSFVREIIKHVPHIFKANALQQIIDAFPDGYHPITAGIGNKITDSIAYRETLIPVENIFIFNENFPVASHEGHPIAYFVELERIIEEKLEALNNVIFT